MASSKPKRVRRTAEEARRVILDAAEKRLEVAGIAGIRLQEVAADVGVSHPAILHHFGSREGLVDAVVKRAVGRLRGEFLEVLTSELDRVQLHELIERVAEVLGRRGHAKLLAWLVLSTQEAKTPIFTPEDFTLGKIGESVAALRAQAAGCDEDSVREDSVFIVLLVAVAIFGESIAGHIMRQSAGIDDEGGAAKRFRSWFAALLLEHIRVQDAAPPSGPTGATPST